MQQCKCVSKHHNNHRGKPCDATPITNDDYCQECHDELEREHADTKPERPAYQPR
jgi:hypothetical protein